jgi:DNA-binding transcriptional ArsR family regulator
MAYQADELVRILKVLAVGTRVRIVQALKGRVLCVGALASQLDVTQGAVSQHLRVMRDAGLVIDEKRGYYVHYRLNQQTLDRWCKQIDEFLAPGPPSNAGVRSTPGRSREV